MSAYLVLEQAAIILIFCFIIIIACNIHTYAYVLNVLQQENRRIDM